MPGPGQLAPAPLQAAHRRAPPCSQTALRPLDSLCVAGGASVCGLPSAVPLPQLPPVRSVLPARPAPPQVFVLRWQACFWQQRTHCLVPKTAQLHQPEGWQCPPALLPGWCQAGAVNPRLYSSLQSAARRRSPRPAMAQRRSFGLPWRCRCVRQNQHPSWCQRLKSSQPCQPAWWPVPAPPAALQQGAGPPAHRPAENSLLQNHSRQAAHSCHWLWAEMLHHPVAYPRPSTPGRRPAPVLHRCRLPSFPGSHRRYRRRWCSARPQAAVPRHQGQHCRYRQLRSPPDWIPHCCPAQGVRRVGCCRCWLSRWARPWGWPHRAVGLEWGCVQGPHWGPLPEQGAAGRRQVAAEDSPARGAHWAWGPAPGPRAQQGAALGEA